MSEAPGPPIVYEQTNKIEDGARVLPVVRTASFVRLAPNSFSVWNIPGEVPEFNIFVQRVENRENAHHLNQAQQAGITKKELVLQVTELAAMTLNLPQIRQLKEAIDGAIALFERQRGGAGGASD